MNRRHFIELGAVSTLGFTMGEYHVGDSYTTKTYHAFKANGEAKCFSNWYEAYKFRQG